MKPTDEEIRKFTIDKAIDDAKDSNYDPPKEKEEDSLFDKIAMVVATPIVPILPFIPDKTEEPTLDKELYDTVYDLHAKRDNNSDK